MLFLVGEVLIALLLIAGARSGFIPELAILAFLPLLVRGGAWSLRSNHSRLQIYRLGKSELFHSILFGVLLIAAFRLHIP